MANRQSTFLLKRSNVAGKIPTSGDLLLGEMALNTADVILYASGTTANSILPIGWDRVARTGDTMTGQLNVPTISATTYLNLPIDVYVTGVTYNNANQFTFTNNTGGTFNTLFNTVTGLTVNGNLTVTGTTNTEILTATTVTGLTTNVNELRFNVDFTGGTAGEGIMFWDEDNGTVSLGMHGGVVSQQIGLEQYYYVKNQSGATIENGRVVRAAGTLGTSGRILGEYMIADGSIEAKYTLGIATEDIVNGDDGYVTEFGLVRGIDTTGSLYGETWSNGDILYVSPTIAGGLTKVRPIAPNLHVEIAIVVYANANGSIFVRPHRYPNLGDLQNVRVNGDPSGSLFMLSGGTWVATQTLNGSYTITGNTSIGGGLTASTVSATTYYGDGSNLTGIVASWDGLQVITAGENVAAGDLLYLSGDSKYYKVNNLVESMSSTELRIAISAITANSTGSGLIQGQYTTTGLTAGDKYWVGSAGNFTSTLPSSEGAIVRYIGTALSTTVLEFNPDQTWLELSTGTTAISTGTTYPAIREITTSQTALANDETIVCLSALTITLPSAVGIAGKTYYIKSRTTGTVTINSTGGQLFDDDTSLTITIKNQSFTIQSDGTNWIIK